MLNNIAITIRPLKEGKPSASGNLLVAHAQVTVPEVGTIRDIVVQRAPDGSLAAFGPSRPSSKPDDLHKFYSIVFLATPLRERIVEEYRKTQQIVVSGL